MHWLSNPYLIRIWIFGLLSAGSYAFFSYKGICIYLGHIHWDWPHSVWPLIVLLVTFALWIAFAGYLHGCERRRCRVDLAQREEASLVAFVKHQILQIAVRQGWTGVNYAMVQAAENSYVDKVKELKKDRKVVDDRNLVPLSAAWCGVGATVGFCVGCVVAYINIIAIRDFDTPQWVTEVSPQSRGFEAPSFAVLRGERDAAFADFSSLIPRKCYYPNYMGENCTASFASMPRYYSPVYGTLTGYIFDGSDIILENSSSKILLQTFVNYNSAAISEGYGTQSPQTPYLYFAVFDPSMSIASFQHALDCGVVALSEMPALGSTTFRIAPYAVKDEVHALDISENCRDIYDDNPPYLYYESEVVPTGELTSHSCDTSMDGYAPYHDCISQVIIRYGTMYLTTQTSKHKKEWNDILVDIGGIVGGVCFVFWFWGIFALIDGE